MNQEKLDQALASHSFGDEVIVTDVGSWQEEEPNHFVVRLYADILWKNKLLKDSISFHVHLNNDNQIENSYGYLHDGSEV